MCITSKILTNNIIYRYTCFLLQVEINGALFTAYKHRMPLQCVTHINIIAEVTVYGIHIIPPYMVSDFLLWLSKPNATKNILSIFRSILNKIIEVN